MTIKPDIDFENELWKAANELRGAHGPEQQLKLIDELEYQARNVYKLPCEATWTWLRENAHQGTTGACCYY